MAMTRKDYELVAKSLAATKRDCNHRLVVELEIVDKTIESLAAHFALMNDNFKKDVFLEAAGHGESSNT